jgi:hypothetical protein
MASGSQGMNNQLMGKQRTNSQKPSSAPSKNRIRSQSPMNIEAQGQQIVSQSYAQQAAQSKNKTNLIGGANFGNNQVNQKILSSSGGYSGMMTHGQGMQNTSN